MNIDIDPVAGFLALGASLFLAFFAGLQSTHTVARPPKPSPEPPKPPVEPVAPPPPPEPPPAPPPAPEPKPKPAKGYDEDMLDRFCTYLRDFEGKPGDRNYRNNNPGNFKISPVGYLKKYGTVRKDKDGFAIFETYALGWEYLRQHTLQKAKKHPTWTILDFFMEYAPPVDSNPTKAYARNVAKRCGVTVDTTLGQLFG